jgi:hypothetical protein
VYNGSCPVLLLLKWLEIMKKNKSSKDLNELCDALKNAKEGEDYIKENGKVFVPCIFDNSKPTIPEWQEAKKGNLYARTIRIKDDQTFAEFAPYCYSLFNLIKENSEWSEVASVMGHAACLAELSARANEKEVRKWYKEMDECINDMVHNTQALLAGAADQFKHI